jgi:hypothetical protein
MSSLNIEYTLYLTGNKVLRNGENQPYIKNERFRTYNEVTNFMRQVKSERNLSIHLYVICKITNNGKKETVQVLETYR